MKNLIFGIVTITTLLLSCTPDNPNPNGNGGQTYTQGTPITDIDGNTYPTIISDCGQTWTAKNLNVSKYRNGDIIPQVTDSTTWRNLTTGAWCYYNNNANNGSIYGKIYNWYALNDARGLAPQGWHVPTDAEWSNLIRCIDPNADISYSSYIQSTSAGGAMKETGTSHWLSPNTGASNSAGFFGLPGGFRDGTGGSTTTILSFGGIGENTIFWSKTVDPSDPQIVWCRWLSHFTSSIGRDRYYKKDGSYVRLVKD